MAVIEPDVVPGPFPYEFEGTTVNVYEVLELKPVNVKEVVADVCVVVAGVEVTVYSVAGREVAGRVQDNVAAPLL